MSNYQPGQRVFIPSIVQDGAFPGEKLVTINTQDGPLSGFVNDNDLVYQGGQQCVSAIVEAVDEKILTVYLSGSFFSTTGLAYLSPDDGLKEAVAAGE